VRQDLRLRNRRLKCQCPRYSFLLSSLSNAEISSCYVDRLHLRSSIRLTSTWTSVSAICPRVTASLVCTKRNELLISFAWLDMINLLLVRRKVRQTCAYPGFCQCWGWFFDIAWRMYVAIVASHRVREIIAQFACDNAPHPDCLACVTKSRKGQPERNAIAVRARRRVTWSTFRSSMSVTLTDPEVVLKPTTGLDRFERDSRLTSGGHLGNAIHSIKI
jgi:hypothetical protein